MFALIPYAQYGNRLSFYGNIQLGAAPQFIQNYGGWPRQLEQTTPEDTQELPPIEIIPDYSADIAKRIATIKRLKAQVDAEQDLTQKNILREQMRKERIAKEHAFQLRARIDEEEATFILLN